MHERVCVCLQCELGWGVCVYLGQSQPSPEHRPQQTQLLDLPRSMHACHIRSICVSAFTTHTHGHAPIGIEHTICVLVHACKQASAGNWSRLTDATRAHKHTVATVYREGPEVGWSRRMASTRSNILCTLLIDCVWLGQTHSSPIAG